MNRELNQVLAKSSGVSLVEHSRLVAKVAVELATQNLMEPDDELIRAIELGALLHDIGKSQETFQKKVMGAKEGVDIDLVEKKMPYRHNEVAWSFLSRFIEFNTNSRVANIVKDIVYWHHGISKDMASYNDTDIEISDNDIDTMRAACKELIGVDLYIEKPYKPKKAPVYYCDDEEVNLYNTFARACVIGADRLVSALESDLEEDDIPSWVSSLNNKKHTVDRLNHTYQGSERFQKQVEITDEADKTTLVKAPAGFGKTLLGLLWSMKSNKRLVWVCPRNMVAESVYRSVIEELKGFGENQVSVELFLTGETIESQNSIGDFSSDIIITNIDNFLAPSVDNRTAHRLASVLTCDVVFDEYHELVSDLALCAGFVNLMLIRNRLTTSRTLLLSATPIEMNRLWDSIGQKTKVLPSKSAHYRAVHNKKYKLNVLDTLSGAQVTENNLVILNSISNAQRFKKLLSAPLLIHSSFQPEDRIKIMEEIYAQYSKNSARALGKPTVVGTHIVQASLDISFLNLYESILSPESTLQRIGRCDRFGDYQGTPIINIIGYQDRGEDAVRELLYTKNLTNVWLEFIRQYDGMMLTLDEIYVLYNTYNEIHEKAINKYVIDKYTKSRDVLCNIYPFKFFGKSSKNVKTAGSNKLRASGSEVFVICRKYNSDEYTDPFSEATYGDFQGTFNEHGNMQPRLLKVMKELRNRNDGRFDYNDILNAGLNMTLDGIRKYARKSNTPYIRFDKVYHAEYGSISEQLLSEIN